MFDFSDSAIPAMQRAAGAGRKPMANPFMDIAGILADNKAIAKSFTLSESDRDKFLAKLKQVNYLLNKAGNAHNVTIRRTIAFIGDEDSATAATFTIWAITQVKRPRKTETFPVTVSYVETETSKAQDARLAAIKAEAE